MEAHSVPAHSLPADLVQPRAKDGGLAAGFVAVLREVGALLANSGGLVVVVVCVLAVMTITSTSMATVPDEQQATVAAAAFTVLGTIVGAYFGVRVGSHGKSEAEAARAVSEAKVARLAAHVPPEQAMQALDAVDNAR
jgi:uncharacterized membrane protein YfcA